MAAELRDELEVTRLKALTERAALNQIEVEWIDAAELRGREPNISGQAALCVKTTGIVDYRKVCERLGELLRQRGAERSGASSLCSSL